MTLAVSSRWSSQHDGSGDSIDPPRIAGISTTNKTAAFLRDSGDKEREGSGEWKRELALAATAPIPVDTSLGDWRRIGPDDVGGKTYDIAVSYQRANVLYAVFHEGGAWKSTDTGQNWQMISHPSNGIAIDSVAVSRTDDAVVYLGPDDSTTGLLASRDGGRSFTTIGPKVATPARFARIVIHPTNDRIIYVSTLTDLYKTVDGGQNWQTILSFPSASPGFWPDFADVAINPAAPSTLLVAQKRIGIKRTTDGGATWTAVGDGLPAIDQPAVIAWSESDPAIVYIQRLDPNDGDPYVFRSQDAGATWTQRTRAPVWDQGRYDMAIAVSPVDPNLVIIANASSTRSTDGGLTWANSQYSNGVDHSAVRFSPVQPSLVFYGADQSVKISTNAGATRGASGKMIRSFHAGAGVGVSIVNGNRRIYYNGGDHWSKVMPDADTARPVSSVSCCETNEFASFFVNPLDPNTVFNTRSGEPVYRTTNRGVDTGWTTVSDGINTAGSGRLQIVFDPSNVDVVYMANVKERGVYKSTQRGANGSWVLIGPTPSIAGARVFNVALAPSNPNIVYAQDDENQVFWTNDGGNHWNQTTPGFAGARNLTVDPVDPSVIYYPARYGARRCTAYGAQCTTLAYDVLGRQVGFFVTDPTHPTWVYAATYTLGVLLSRDNGATWKRVGNNLPKIDVNYLAWTQGRLYASNYQGIWELRSDSYGQPAAVATLTATAHASAARIDLAWPAASGATGYQLFRDETLVLTSTAAERQFTDTGLDSLTRYCYQVSAINLEGAAIRSAPACATTTLTDRIFAGRFDN
ncbi:MAG: hypothetical protein JNN30_12440 [Rhodanobacteraceae bacterium]|nr:hypothetical protein [Rhodanobacteraceae bacterium]